MELSSEIVSGKELEKANRERKRDYIFENIVEEARDRYIEEGWEVDRELANRKVKMKKLNPLTKSLKIVFGQCCTNLVSRT